MPVSRPGFRISRGRFLRTAGTLLGSGLAVASGAGAAFAASSSESSRESSGGAGGKVLHQPQVEAKRLGNLTGPGLTTEFRMEATDLGAPTITPDGRMLFVFGDTFEDACVGCGWWRSPTGLYSTTTDLNGGLKWSGAVTGDAGGAKQLLAYEHNNGEFTTILPSDVITIGDTMYLHASAVAGLGNTVWSGIWQSKDNGTSWQDTGTRFAPDLHDGLFQLWTWEQGDDGFIYVFSTMFDRTREMILHRVPTEKILDANAYQPWGYQDEHWAWGNPPTPVLDGKFGEMCLRRIEDVWMLTWLNITDGRMDCMILNSPTDNLFEAHRVPLLWGTSWGNEDDYHVAQMYGPYIIPGSTLDELHLMVSQWNTEQGWPYHVMQFRFRNFAP